MKPSLIPVIILLFSLSSFLASAQQLAVTDVPILSRVEPGETARFALVVRNVGDVGDVFKIRGDPQKASPFSPFYTYVSATPNQFRLDPGKTVTLDVEVHTSERAPVEESFLASLVIESVSVVDFVLPVTVETYVLDRAHIFDVFFKDVDALVPGTEHTFTVVVKNRKQESLRGVEVHLVSQIPGVKSHVIRNFRPEEEQIVSFSYFIPQTAQPGTHDVEAQTYLKNVLRGGTLLPFVVKEKAYIGVASENTSSFFVRRIVLEKENLGNAPAQQRITHRLGLLQSVFTSATPQPTSLEGGTWIWTFMLQPGESFSVVLVTNYVPVLYGLLVILFVFFGFVWHLRHSVTLRKRLFVIPTPEAGVYQIKVLLILRNGKRTHLTQVRVLDILPHGMDTHPHFVTMKPGVVQQGMHGQRFVWDLETLQPREERVFTYVLRVRLYDAPSGILPAATMHYLYKGNTKRVKSDRLSLHHYL